MIALESNADDDQVLGDLALDLTPMLDILFILLVFFMLTAGTVFQSFEVNLPSSVTDDVPPLGSQKNIVLEITTNGYALDGHSFSSFSTLKEAIPDTLRDHPGYELVIASDRRVDVERLLAVLTYLQSKGIVTANVLLNREQM